MARRLARFKTGVFAMLEVLRPKTISLAAETLGLNGIIVWIVLYAILAVGLANFELHFLVRH